MARRVTGGGWKAAAAARLDGIDPFDQHPEKGEKEAPIDDGIDASASISDLDAEIDALHAKLRHEQEAINEARALRGRRRNGLSDIDGAIQHAKRDKSESTTAEDKPFFLTSVAGEVGVELEPAKPRKLSMKEMYPNFKNEKRLAAIEKGADRQAKEIAQLKASGNKMLVGGGASKPATKQRGSGSRKSSSGSQLVRATPQALQAHQLPKVNSR